MIMRQTPDHPDVPARHFEPINGPNAKRSYAPGSVEYELEQKRLCEKADKPPPAA
jgi:hypothetical protein